MVPFFVQGIRTDIKKLYLQVPGVLGVCQRVIFGQKIMKNSIFRVCGTYTKDPTNMSMGHKCEPKLFSSQPCSATWEYKKFQHFMYINHDDLT